MVKIVCHGLRIERFMNVQHMVPSILELFHLKIQGGWEGAILFFLYILM